MAIIDGLISYWKLEEASGTRVDSHGANDLTPANAPGNAAGRIGSACQFVAATGQSLDRSPLGTLATAAGTDLTVQAWVYLDSTPGEGDIVHNDFAGGGFIMRASSGTLQWIVGATAVSGGTLSTGAWYHLVGRYRASDGRADLTVNAGTPAAATGATIGTGSAPFQIGARFGTFNAFDGRIDEVGKWDRYLSDGEIASLYNGGAGLAYPFGGGAAKPWWVFASQGVIGGPG